MLTESKISMHVKKTVSATIKSHNTKSFPSKEDLATYGALVMPNVWAIRIPHELIIGMFMICVICVNWSSVVTISCF